MSSREGDSIAIFGVTKLHTTCLHIGGQSHPSPFFKIDYIEQISPVKEIPTHFLEQATHACWLNIWNWLILSEEKKLLVPLLNAAWFALVTLLARQSFAFPFWKTGKCSNVVFGMPAEAWVVTKKGEHSAVWNESQEGEI